MKLPGFNAESSLAPSKGTYSAKNLSLSGASAQTGRGTVVPAKPRQQWCETKYRAYVSHWFPVTVCRPLSVDLSNSVAAMAKVGPSGLTGTFDSRAGTALQLRGAQKIKPGAFQDCRTVALPFIADVTTTEACDDAIPDLSVMKVYGHPELTTVWNGGINDIPAPYNPGWFGQVGQDCGCCGGFQECPDGSCKPLGVSCDNVPA